jgi:DNA-binding response OmpR family regulator
MKSRILFVDDQAPVREMLSGFFRDKGYEVRTASTGEQAMVLADEGGYDLIILDINLAGESGLELLGFFKTNMPTVPVVMFTGMPDEALLDQAMARGASGYMRKTDSMEDLLAAVKVYIPSR